MNDFINHVLPAVTGFASDDWRAKSVLGISLVPRPGTLIEVRIGEGTGVQSNAGLPSFCAGLLSLRTGVGGRSGHGRLYIPGVDAELSPDSRLDGVYLSILSNIGTVLLARYGSTGAANIARFGVFSRRLGVTRNPGPPASLVYSLNGFFPVTTFVARIEIATQRKRMLHRGQ